MDSNEKVALAIGVLMSFMASSKVRYALTNNELQVIADTIKVLKE